MERLDYEAYTEMAEARIRAIADEEADRHGLLAVAVQHRTGSVSRRAPSVIAAVAAAHREEAVRGGAYDHRSDNVRCAHLEGEITPEGTRDVLGILPEGS